MKTGIDSYVCTTKDFSWRGALDQPKRDGANVLRSLVDPKTVDFAANRAKWFLSRPALSGVSGFRRSGSE